MKKTIGTTLIVAALAFTSACGGGGGRPSQADIAKELKSKDSVFGSTIPASAADCVAGVLEKSKLTDDTLNAIVEGDKGYNGNKGDEKVLLGLSSKFAECVTK